MRKNRSCTLTFRQLFTMILKSNKKNSYRLERIEYDETVENRKCDAAKPLYLRSDGRSADLPFRVLCKEQGAGLLCMEMVSAKAILYNNKNTESLLEIHPDEQPVSLQFFGSDPKIMSEMAKRVEERPFDIMDINMGCPVPKVVRNGEGSALMKNQKLVYEIVSAMVKAIDKPVTVKIRKDLMTAALMRLRSRRSLRRPGQQL